MANGTNADFYRIAREHVKRKSKGRSRSAGNDDQQQFGLHLSGDPGAPSERFGDFILDALSRGEQSEMFLRAIIRGGEWDLDASREEQGWSVTVDLEGYRYRGTGSVLKEALSELRYRVRRGPSLAEGQSEIESTVAVHQRKPRSEVEAAVRHFNSLRRRFNAMEKPVPGQRRNPERANAFLNKERYTAIREIDRKHAETLGIEIPEGKDLKYLAQQAGQYSHLYHDETWGELHKGGEVGGQKEFADKKVSDEETRRTDRHGKKPTP